MEITVPGTPPFVQVDDGTWVTEATVAAGHVARRQRYAL
jgi:hypothetical protein